MNKNVELQQQQQGGGYQQIQGNQQGYPQFNQQNVNYQSQGQPYAQQYPPQQYPIQQQGYPPMAQGQAYQQIPMQQYQMVPQQMQIMNPGFGNPGSTLQYLQTLPALFIKQKLELIEAFTGCESQNHYQVFAADVNGKKKGDNPFLKIKEKSGCFQRICLPGDCRAFDLKTLSLIEGKANQVEYEKANIFKASREFRCTCLCLDRPELNVYISQPKNPNGQEENKYIGKIIKPFLCCSVGLDIYDQQNFKKYTIEGELCQCGIICRQFPCQSCQEAFFNIYNDKHELVSRLTKTSAGCCKAAISDVDNFSVQFPTNATLEDKVLFLHATILLDYSYFEENPQDNNRQSRYTSSF